MVRQVLDMHAMCIRIPKLQRKNNKFSRWWLIYAILWGSKHLTLIYESVLAMPPPADHFSILPHSHQEYSHSSCYERPFPTQIWVMAQRVFALQLLINSAGLRNCNIYSEARSSRVYSLSITLTKALDIDTLATCFSLALYLYYHEHFGRGKYYIVVLCSWWRRNYRK